MPQDLFNAPISDDAPAAVDAQSLTFDAKTGIITAIGDVVFDYDRYRIKGQRLVFNRQTNDVKFIGTVTIIDPSGNVLETENFSMTGGMKRALISSFTITAYDGSRLTADSADYDAALQTLLTNAKYTPCGSCVDDKGRRIGWSVSARTITTNELDGSLYMEQPHLEVLGIPIAWLPFLWLPDTSDTILDDIETISVDYSEDYGTKVTVPYRAYSSRYTDVILTPTLLSQQGLLVGAEWRQRFDNGAIRIKASGLYQFGRSKFAGRIGDRDWRGAIQTSGEFRPVQDWTVGWSYTAFTDAAYFSDYALSTDKSSINEVYAQNLTQDTFIDARLQQFNQLGEVTAAAQNRQGSNLPVVRFDNVTRLAQGMGQFELSGRLLGIQRSDEPPTRTINGVPYKFGYAGNKLHVALQAGWQNQYIGAGGFVATPYLGTRLDLAQYDGTGTFPGGATSLFSATPIAAMDVRFPMAASDGSTVQLIEPIAQLVYRGSDTTAVGITNDNAQSFVFDDTNLFSYNRFSGSDRQETGLRANIGGRYQANFTDGSYLELIAGQSFQLAGPNAFAMPDQAQTGLGSGMDISSSYAVIGAYGAMTAGIMGGGKVQIDTTTGGVSRAGLGVSYANANFSALLDYDFIAANAATGVLDDQHEIGTSLRLKIADYWSVAGSTYWDLRANSWLQVGGELQYDDGYLLLQATASRTGPTHTSPDETRITGSVKLKAPAGFNVGYTGNLPGF
ncbi:LPS assembly protein LptD [Devosia rhodophyticola]|uniref:LPS-assembly protein LptD n=1 Tax=Devosia rhodophyticola TaxID=3026423 RepID=A0ABY7YW55_9HYPH|nr:LPS assembly protein LptD [Devosia rhodophyticola]WDR05600.1 LPS assembly protein LptD [Devosia rhodophyticola]